MKFNSGYSLTQSARSNIFSYIIPCSLNYNSLEIVDEGATFALTFTYNANSNTYISIFVNVCEQENLLLNMTEKFEIAERTAFEKHILCAPGENKAIKMPIKFSFASLMAAKMRENESMPESKRYRFVVRTEPEKHPHRFVNSYYYDLETVAEKVRPKLVKHKIELKDQAYYVYEIYGIESVNGNSVLNANSIEQLCKICLDNLIAIIVLPCRHMCLCLECAKLYNERNANNTKKMKPECPVCKCPIQSFLNIQGKNILTNVPLN